PARSRPRRKRTTMKSSRTSRTSTSPPGRSWSPDCTARRTADRPPLRPREPPTDQSQGAGPRRRPRAPLASRLPLMADVIIDLIAPDDLGEVVTLYNQIFRPARGADDFERRYLGRHNVVQMVARLNHRPVGFLLGFE